MTEKKPKVQEKEIDKLQKQFDDFEKQVKDLTQDRMNEAKVEEVEPQTKLSSKEIDNAKKIWLKPKRSLSDGQKFNETYRQDLNFSKEYVQFVAEHKELIGETIEIWTHPFGGMAAEYWEVPTNKPVWGPRYLAEQIRKCNYHRLKTDQGMVTSSDGMGSYFGTLVVDNIVPRLTAEPVSDRRSVFTGSKSFAA